MSRKQEFSSFAELAIALGYEPAVAEEPEQDKTHGKPAETKAEEPGFEQGRREYVGLSGKTFLTVAPVYDHWFLSRIYSKQVKVSWRFNKAGRIEIMDAMEFPINDITHIIKPYKYKGDNPSWMEIEADYRWINVLDIVNSGFPGLDIEEKIQSLLRFGYSMARQVDRDIQTGNLRAANYLRDKQKHLTQIVGDADAVYLIQHAGSLMPSTRILGEKRIMICY